MERGEGQHPPVPAPRVAPREAQQGLGEAGAVNIGQGLLCTLTTSP